MRVMSVDQSLSHCAVVIFENEVPTYREMIRTGSTKSKGKQSPDVYYFDTVYEQIEHICKRINELCAEYCPEEYVMESLSLGSIGSATRDLAGLFYCIALSLDGCGNHFIEYYNIHTVAPTSVKSFARRFLPEEDQQVKKERVDKRTNKPVYSTGKVKMDKSQMVKACENSCPGWLDGLTLAAGKADYADAYFIGLKFITDKREGS